MNFFILLSTLFIRLQAGFLAYGST